ncbi:unnamed protein product [Acanthoscelides obtectus]|uniref:Protein stoned-B n=1 Tax=Acanthoscelides obtectus TaxID=200917 RepID=A0A9P0MFQ7_ACAOB|nr:unnamed protein product [Acanthoscelides obtectus]CAK1636375.1 Protein stoned-B [Acanthoscelides obtectus]
MTSANPFFFSEEPYGAAAAPTAAASNVSNPFLFDDDGDDGAQAYENTFGAASDNPFLSQTATTMSTTNPFSYDPMDLEPAEGEVAQIPHQQDPSPSNDLFGTSVATNEVSNVPVSSFFDSNDVQQVQPVQPVQQIQQPPRPPAPVVPPTIDLFSDEKNDVMFNSMPQKPVNLDLTNTSQSNSLPPRPAAPPPRPPLANETRALLAQVTGTMDATSTSLLDKIPPTRTPSPVSMRDLHSPSPTPDILGADLQEGAPMDASIGNQEEGDLVSFSQDTCDINQNPQSTATSAAVTSSQEATTTSKPAAKPPRPTPPRPPKPQPPKVKPPVPEEPPKVAASPAVAPAPIAAPANDDDFDLFGTSNARPPKPVTKDDILNLYNAPKQHQQQDLLSDPVEVYSMSAPATSPVPPITTGAAPDISTPMSTDSATHAIITNASSAACSPSQLSQKSDDALDNVFSPDQHSKRGSMTSATFNPFSGAPTPSAVPAAVDSSLEEKPMDVREDQVDAAQITPEIQQPSSTDSVLKEEPVSISMRLDQNPPSVEQVHQNDTTQPMEHSYSPFGAEQPSKADDVFAQTFSQTVGSFEGSPMPPSASQDIFGPMDTTQDNFQKPDAVPVSGAQNTFAQESPAYAVPDTNQDPFGSTAPSTTVSFRSAPPPVTPRPDPFGSAAPPVTQRPDPFGSAAPPVTPRPDPFGSASNEFDDFEKKFDSMNEPKISAGVDAWGNESMIGGFGEGETQGFGQEEGFDAFLALQEPPTVPQSTPNRVSKAPSQESDEGNDFSVFIRPKGNEEYQGGAVPSIAPPPATVNSAFSDSARFNPFDNQTEAPEAALPTEDSFAVPKVQRTDSQETPPTPLFDDDTSVPLEPFPRIDWSGEGWEMHLRQPNKKKITGQRFWKKIFVKIVNQMDCTLLQLFNQKDDKDPFQELPLQPCYSVSEIGAQQYDQFGKIFTIKLQYIFYKERPGVRPGQMKKAEKITNKLSQFAAYAIQGDYQGVKEFGSDLKKLGLPVEHAPQVSQLLKIGSLNFEDLKQFSFCIEEALFKLAAHRDRALHYKMEEVQVTAVDELYVEQDAEGHVEKQIARVRLFFLGFLTGMPDIELGVNDMRRQGKEVVGRHDIIPVVTEEWIRLEDVEFHSCIQQEDYHQTHIIKFKPPDACYIELMRFRVRPPKNRELPLQLKAQICVTGHKVELRADVLVPGFASRKLGQIPCEDVMIRFPIPECWIYLFRVEKHFRYGSVKSAHRRTGKIKGIERILGTMETLQENLIEVTSGQAKYEHQHRAIVWRCPRLPKEGQGAYTTHNMVCRIALTSYDQMPEKLAEYCYVEFTMPATQVSHTTVRSVSLQNSDSDEPPEKYVRYLARHEYRVGIEHTEGENPNPYAAATYVTKPAATPEPTPAPAPVPEESSSDSD